MKRIFLLALFYLLTFTANAQNREAIQGYCERGGEAVMTDGRASTTKVQRTFSSCTVRVFVAGTTTPAVIASDNSGTPKSNPFVADTDGYWKFYVPAGRYDVRMEGAGITTPFTRSGYWISSGGASSIPSCTAGQMLYYATTGSVPTCLGLGNTMNITNGLLNSTASGGGGSGTILPNPNQINYLSVYNGQGTTVGPSTLRLNRTSSFDLYQFEDSAIQSSMTASNIGSVGQPAFSLGKGYTFGGTTTDSAYNFQIGSDFTAGTFSGGNANIFSLINSYTGSSIGVTSGVLSEFRAQGGAGSTWSNFRSRFTQNSSSATPSNFYSFYSEPPTLTLGSVAGYTGFYAQAPTSLNGISTYRAFHSTGGTNTFRLQFSSDGVDLTNGMTLRMYGSDNSEYSSSFAAWGFSPTQAVSNYTYLLPDTTPEVHKHLTVSSISGRSIRLGWEMGVPSCSPLQMIYYKTVNGMTEMTCLSTGSNISIDPVTNTLNAAGGGGGGGTVTNVSGTLPVVSSGGTTPAISLASAYGDTLNPYGSKTTKTFLAAPADVNGVPTFRTITAADLPNLPSYQPINSNLTTIGGLIANNGDWLNYNGSSWVSRPILKGDVGLGSVENTALSTWPGSANITTVGNITLGTWNGTVIGATKGGAGNINGVLKADGSGVVSAAEAGTDFAPATPKNVPSGRLLTNNGSGGFESLTIGSGLQVVSGNLQAISGGSGTVTSVSVVNANGVSGTVATPDTTPAITLILGNILPTSVNGLTFTSNATGWSIAGGTTSKTLTLNNTLSLSGTDNASLNIGAGGTLGSAAYTSSGNYLSATTQFTNSNSTLTMDGPGLIGFPSTGTGSGNVKRIRLGAGLEFDLAGTGFILNSLASNNQNAGLVFASDPNSTSTPSWIKLSTKHLNDYIIDSTKLASSAVTTAAIAANAVTDVKIADGAITTSKIGNSQVTIAKLAATGTPSGSVFLRGDGVWATPSGGGSGGVGNTTTPYIPYNSGGATPQFDNSPLQVANGGITLTRTNSTTNVSQTAMTISTTSSGVPVANFGSVLDVQLKAGTLGTPTNVVASRLATTWSTAGTSPTSFVEFFTYGNGGTQSIAKMFYDAVNTYGVFKVGGSSNILGDVGGNANHGRIAVHLMGDEKIAVIKPNQSFNTAAGQFVNAEIRNGLLFPTVNLGSESAAFQGAHGMWWVPAGSSSSFGELAGLYFDKAATGASTGGLTFTAGTANFNRFILRKSHTSSVDLGAKMFEFNMLGTNDQATLDLYYTTTGGGLPTALRFRGSNNTSFVGLTAPVTVNASVDYKLPGNPPSNANGSLLLSDTGYNMTWRALNGTGNILGANTPLLDPVTHATIQNISTVGTFVYCSDCVRNSTTGGCDQTGVGGGTFAFRTNQTPAWRCL